MRVIIACVLMVGICSLEAQAVDKKELNILFIGKTGAGKSTLINVLYNHITGKTFDSVPRDLIIPLCHLGKVYPVSVKKYLHYGVNLVACDVKHGGRSQTSKVHKYIAAGTDYTVNLWDAPGFMDTEGSVKDRDNTDEIVSALAGVSINAIVVVTKSDDYVRYTAEFKANINNIQRMLPSSAGENLIGIFNRASGVKLDEKRKRESEFRDLFNLSSASEVYFLDGSTFFDTPGDEDDIANRRNWDADSLKITKLLEDAAHKIPVNGDEAVHLLGLGKEAEAKVVSLTQKLVQLQNKKLAIQLCEENLRNKREVRDSTGDYHKTRDVHMVRIEEGKTCFIWCWGHWRKETPYVHKISYVDEQQKAQYESALQAIDGLSAKKSFIEQEVKKLVDQQKKMACEIVNLQAERKQKAMTINLDPYIAYLEEKVRTIANDASLTPEERNRDVEIYQNWIGVYEEMRKQRICELTPEEQANFGDL